MGEKNADGSASFYGADGSNSYYGNNGTWGYKNSDGISAYYGGLNQDDCYYDADADDDDNNDDNDDDDDELSSDSDDLSGLLASTIGAAIGLGAIKYSQRRENVKRKLKDEQKPKGFD